MRMDPFAAEPKWYLTSLLKAVPTGEFVGFLKYQNATAAANTNCWQAVDKKVNYWNKKLLHMVHLIM